MNLPDNDTLVALVERMASGDAEALGELWDQVSPWVHAALLRMLRDEEAAELLTRATVIEMWRLAPMWDEHVGQPLLWAVANARNLGCQWLSGRRRGHEDGPATTAPSAELIRDARDPASQVGAALEALGEAGHDTLDARGSLQAVDVLRVAAEQLAARLERTHEAVRARGRVDAGEETLRDEAEGERPKY